MSAKVFRSFVEYIFVFHALLFVGRLLIERAFR